ncbi:MAG: hypothetical protein ABIM74_05245 [candidate division WOR-3 bacterium]
MKCCDVSNGANMACCEPDRGSRRFRCHILGYVAKKYMKREEVERLIEGLIKEIEKLKKELANLKEELK